MISQDREILKKSERKGCYFWKFFSILSIFSLKIMLSRIITQISEIQVILFNMIYSAYFFGCILNSRNSCQNAYFLAQK